MRRVLVLVALSAVAAAALALGGCASLQYSALGCRDNIRFSIDRQLQARCDELALRSGG